MSNLAIFVKNFIYRATFRDLWGNILFHRYSTKLSKKLYIVLKKELLNIHTQIEHFKMRKILFEKPYCNLFKLTKKTNTLWKPQQRNLIVSKILLQFIMSMIYPFIKINMTNKTVIKIFACKLFISHKFQNYLANLNKNIIRNNFIKRFKRLEITKFKYKKQSSVKILFNIKKLIKSSFSLSSILDKTSTSLSFSSLFQFTLYRIQPKARYLTPTHLNFRTTATKYNLTEKLQFFKLYKVFLSFGWDISKYVTSREALYLKIKHLILQNKSTLFDVLEYSFINILYRANFITCLYQARHIILKGGFFCNKVILTNPEHPVNVWDFIGPIQELRMILYKFILNKLFLSKIKFLKIKQYKILLHQQDKNNSCETEFRQENKKRINLKGSGTSKINLNLLKFSKLQQKIISYYNIRSFTLLNLYRQPILLNYPKYMEVTYKCFVICPFRELKTNDFTKIFPNISSGEHFTTSDIKTYI